MESHDDHRDDCNPTSDQEHCQSACLLDYPRTQDVRDNDWDTEHSPEKPVIEAAVPFLAHVLELLAIRNPDQGAANP